MNTLQKLFLIALLIVTFSVPVFAGNDRQTTNLVRTDNREAGISQRSAISIAQRQIKGRVLDIKRNNNVYRVKILSDQGSIHIVQVNAIDGTIESRH